uniref:Uncharacterized protein n=1 Tax=Cyprinus carpio TaxID=7962 RepID=A0A8C1GC73_CYPCA
MGKRQHQKDKMYITCTEYTHFYGGKKSVLCHVREKNTLQIVKSDICMQSTLPFKLWAQKGFVFALLFSKDALN